MSFAFTNSDIIALLALVISGYVAWHQRGINASQAKVNDLLLRQGEAQDLEARRADLGATYLKLGKGSHRLKIWNKGKAVAKNIKINFPDGNDLISETDLARKFPLESLDQFQSVELTAYRRIGSREKYHLLLTWDDPSGEGIVKSVYVTI